MSRLTKAGLLMAGRIVAPSSPHYGVALIRTVIEVETRGSGYDRKGRVIILYEPHIAWRVSSGATRDALAAAGLAYEDWGSKPYPRDSYPRFEAARKIDANVAHLSCSWGLPQIMGGNHKAAGYPNAQAMAEAFKAGGEDEQVAAMARLIKATPVWHSALLARDWHAFARGYNGPGYAKNGYHLKLPAAFAKYERDPWVGFNSPPASGATLEDQRRKQADAAIAATTATGAAATTTGAVVVPELPPKPAEATAVDWMAVGLFVGLVVLAGFGVMQIKKFSRSAPREQMQEGET